MRAAKPRAATNDGVSPRRKKHNRLAPVPFWLKAFFVPKRTMSENSTDVKRKDELLAVYKLGFSSEFRVLLF